LESDDNIEKIIGEIDGQGLLGGIETIRRKALAGMPGG
jgi:hypothetical protein